VPVGHSAPVRATHQQIRTANLITKRTSDTKGWKEEKEWSKLGGEKEDQPPNPWTAVMLRGFVGLRGGKSHRRGHQGLFHGIGIELPKRRPGFSPAIVSANQSSLLEFEFMSKLVDSMSHCAESFHKLSCTGQDFSPSIVFSHTHKFFFLSLKLRIK
jgi:hypothetical protein